MNDKLIDAIIDRLMVPDTSNDTTSTVDHSYPFTVGCCYFIRTVTYHMVGRLEGIVGHFMVLSDASWSADDGRFMQTIQEGIIDEVEPVGVAFININSITDAFPWVHNLPTEQK